jgi:hypothetical protein
MGVDVVLVVFRVDAGMVDKLSNGEVAGCENQQQTD